VREHPAFFLPANDLADELDLNGGITRSSRPIGECGDNEFNPHTDGSLK